MLGRLFAEVRTTNAENEQLQILARQLQEQLVPKKKKGGGVGR